LQLGDFKKLGVASSIYFLSSNLTSMFLPVYYIRLGLGISDIAALLLITFMIIGFCQQFYLDSSGILRG
jgi:hypothetical protein